MGRYLEIANQVISGVDNQPLAESDSKTSSSTHCEKSELSERSLEKARTPQVWSVNQWSKKLQKFPDELRAAAGDDWAELSKDPAQLIAFASLEATRQIRESGAIPDSYVAMSLCDGCQRDVPIFVGCPPIISGCPWCFNRIKGLPMPMRRTAARGAK